MYVYKLFITLFLYVFSCIVYSCVLHCIYHKHNLEKGDLACAQTCEGPMETCLSTTPVLISAPVVASRAQMQSDPLHCKTCTAPGLMTLGLRYTQWERLGLVHPIGRSSLVCVS